MRVQIFQDDLAEYLQGRRVIRFHIGQSQMELRQRLFKWEGDNVGKSTRSHRGCCYGYTLVRRRVSKLHRAGIGRFDDARSNAEGREQAMQKRLMETAIFQPRSDDTVFAQCLNGERALPCQGRMARNHRDKRLSTK